MQTHDHSKPSLASTILDVASAHATLMPPRQCLSISPKAEGQNWTGFGSLCPVRFTTFQQALCSLVPSHPQLPHGANAPLHGMKPVCWAVALPTLYFRCFEHKTTATPPHYVASYGAGFWSHYTFSSFTNWFPLLPKSGSYQQAAGNGAKRRARGANGASARCRAGKELGHIGTKLCLM